MIVEFRKIKHNKQKIDFKLDNDINVKGEFFFNHDKKMVQLDANLIGNIDFECCRCGEIFEKNVDLDLHIFIYNGLIKNNHDNDEFDYVIYEISDHKIDFISIIKSEIDSYKLDYHICSCCQETEKIDIEC